MNINNEDGIYSITQNLIAKVVSNKEQYIKDVIIEYARKRSQELGQEVEALFIDQDMANEIIDLGVKAYMERRNKK